MKGGHGWGPVCEDLLIAEGPPVIFAALRIATRNTQGTGCSLSSAIAAELAGGKPLAEAVGRAHGWLQEAIAAADDLRIGSGHAPVHHFHGIWA